MVEAKPAPDLSSLFQLEGKTALLVGGYGGIGRITCELLAHHGAAIAVAGRTRAKAESFAEELAGRGIRALGTQVDVADRASTERLIDEVVSELGSVDILVDLASDLLEEKAEDFGEEAWHRVIESNLSGAFWLSQSAGRAMIAAGNGGRIIHFSSVRSTVGGRRGYAAYGASKAGLNLLVKQLATEWARHGINVNAVAPGFVATEMMAGTMEDQRFTNMVLARIPLGRFAEPIEIASAVLYLASPASSFVTGQILFVDGGVTASQ
jgi:NAD(P)-dependent dehydrogenase (short-subunit alcohol dehydrogenase family)